MLLYLLAFNLLALPILHNLNDLCLRHNQLERDRHRVCRVFAWLPFCLCLIRAPLTVPGHSGMPVIEAELRVGTDGGDGGVWT